MCGGDVSQVPLIWNMWYPKSQNNIVDDLWILRSNWTPYPISGASKLNLKSDMKSISARRAFTLIANNQLHITTHIVIDLSASFLLISLSVGWLVTKSTSEIEPVLSKWESHKDLNIARIANAVQVTICLQVSTSIYYRLLVSSSVY